MRVTMKASPSLATELQETVTAKQEPHRKTRIPLVPFYVLWYLNDAEYVLGNTMPSLGR